MLAHAPDTTAGVDRALIEAAVARHTAMIPTLSMFARTVTADPAYLQPIYAVVRQFHSLGGELLFGTDVGYMTDYSTGDEFRALAECGLDAREMLRMLTTAPARRFGVAAKGRVELSRPADLVVLDGDSETDPAAFTRVRFTVRAGRVVYACPACQS